ncbi:hypothetical protein EDD58_102131 [Hazenella coriacea]|uniref:Uncharacterized protein n=1 Tax=Hazenella coriacea TaxID=1179467 RepID=A0A4V2UVF1_9BACL|nr:hypothetical protein EDD58_102131 [Hazenella coriacea]
MKVFKVVNIVLGILLCIFIIYSLLIDTSVNASWIIIGLILLTSLFFIERSFIKNK